MRIVQLEFCVLKIIKVMFSRTFQRQNDKYHNLILLSNLLFVCNVAYGYQTSKPVFRTFVQILALSSDLDKLVESRINAIIC